MKRSSGRSGYVFWLAAFSALTLKLWMASAIAIIPAYAPHDASNFVTHAASAASGDWLGPYNQLTLIKGPLFPLFLAANSKLGLALPLAHQLLFFGACLLACIAIRPLVTDSRLLAAVFVIVFFDPYTLGYTAWFANRSTLAESLALLSIACCAGLYLRRTARLRVVLAWSTAFGCSAAAYSLTREDGVWLLPAFGILLVPVAITAWRSQNVRRDVLAASIALPYLVFSLGDAAVAETNAHVYGWRTVVEVQSPEYLAAYGSLARIAAPRPSRVPVPFAALAKAYRVSVAARELRPALNGPIGAGWIENGCTGGLCSEIRGGWFLWALRDAVADAGHYDSARDARSFYLRLGSQIDAACLTRTIACSAKHATLTPPMSAGDAPNLGAELPTAFDDLMSLGDDAAPVRSWASADTPADVASDYVTIARSVAPLASPDAARARSARSAGLAFAAGIARGYALFAGWLLGASAVLALVRVARFAIGRERERVESLAVELAAVFGVFGFLVLLSLTDFYSFPAFNPEYFSVVYPVALFAIAVTVSVELPHVLRTLGQQRIDAGAERS